MARRFGTSKFEILRRAVQSLASQEAQWESNGLQALEDLQKRVDLSKPGAEDWAAQVWRERAAMGRDRADD